MNDCGNDSMLREGFGVFVVMVSMLLDVKLRMFGPRGQSECVMKTTK